MLKGKFCKQSTAEKRVLSDVLHVYAATGRKGAQFDDLKDILWLVPMIGELGDTIQWLTFFYSLEMQCRFFGFFFLWNGS